VFPEGDSVGDGPFPVWSHAAGAQDLPLVVLVHGTMDRSAGLLRLSRRLDERFHVLRYDRRGYGRSAARPGPFGIDDQVADLIAVIAGRRAVVFGHSFGGDVALAAAQRRPDLVAAVATYEAPVSWLPWWPGWRSPPDADAQPRRDPADSAERFIVGLIGRERWDSLPERTRAARRAEGPAMVAELRSLAAAPPWDGDRIRVPVVVGVGADARAFHQHAAQHIESNIPGAQRVTLAGCDHDAPSVAPHLVADEVLAPAFRRAGVPWSTA
jgi:pimeloyl-ACP methyl ester carboxylesterase